MAQAALGCVGVQRYTYKIRRHGAFLTLLSDYNYQLNDNGVPKGSERCRSFLFQTTENLYITSSIGYSRHQRNRLGYIQNRSQRRHNDSLRSLGREDDKKKSIRLFDKVFCLIIKTLNRYRTEQIIRIIVSTEEKPDQQIQCRC